MDETMTYQSFNPATGKLLQKFDEITDAEFETKIVVAEKCFESWRPRAMTTIRSRSTCGP